MPSFYAACLASYNNGVLHGRWIEADSDPDVMAEQVTAMLKASPIEGAEEWAMHDYVDLPSSFGEYAGLGAIAEFMELVEEHSEIDPGDLCLIVSDFGSVEEAGDAFTSDAEFRDWLESENQHELVAEIFGPQELQVAA